MNKAGVVVVLANMKRLIARSAALLLIISCVVRPAVAGDEVARFQSNPKIVDDRSPHWPDLGKVNAYGNWQMGNFDFLDKWADRLRDPELVTQNGLSYVAEFYSQFLNGRFLDGDEEYSAVWHAAYKKWVQRNPQSPVPHILHATHLRGRAWTVRGGGYVNSVAKRDMASFSILMGEARDVLLRCEVICSGDSYWYFLIFDIEASLGVDRQMAMGRLLDGIERFPKAHYLYTGAVNYLRPEWGGSVNEIQQWANFAARNTKADNGDELYARVFWAAAGRENLNNWHDYSKEHWSRLIAGMREVLAKYPTAHNYAGFVKVACRARNKDEVEKNWRLMAQHTVPPGDPEINAEEYCQWGKQAEVGRRPNVPGYPPSDGTRKAKAP
jgi:hypothetical protein